MTIVVAVLVLLILWLFYDLYHVRKAVETSLKIYDKNFDKLSKWIGELESQIEELRDD